MTQVTVHLTEEFILEGIPGLCDFCPLALAINAILKPEWETYVCTGSIGIYSEETPEDGLLLIPEPPLIRFMIDFDDGKRVYPFDFEIDVPGEILA